MKLRTKLWLLVAASSITAVFVFISITLLLGALFNEGYTHETLNELGKTLASEAEQLDSDPDQVTALFDRFSEQHPQLTLEWVSKDGSILYATDGRKQLYSFDEMMNRFLNMPSSLWEPNRTITLVHAWGQDSMRQYLTMSLPSEAMQRQQFYFYVRDNMAFIQLLLPLVLFIMTPYIFALYFFTRLNRRLKKLNQAMNDVDAHKSIIQLDDQSKDEIGQLTRHFNVMSERINNQVTQIQEFENKRKTLIANISHDLRTPMTVIQGYAETLHAGMYQDEEERKNYSDIVLRRSRYMDQLLQKLLEISQLDTHRDRIRLEQTNISEQLRRIAADYVHILENRGLEFDIRIPEQAVYCLIDNHLIERAVRNLIENAIQYGNEGKYLGLRLDVNESEIEISVTDRGAGIPKEQQTLVFDRFFRGSEGREGEGIGIGLSIVHEIAAAHDGKVELNSTPSEETSFTVILPKASHK